ncbi:MAG: FtsX-like permease family protein [Gemmatimonadetes bacterium]|nr:FtsX-like permease family protein [Gemmatimonadota bacterium]
MNRAGRWGLGTVTLRGVRRLGRSPAYAASVALTLGISLGALGSVATMVHRAVLEPLPYEAPERLLTMTETSRGDRISTAYLNYLDWRSQATTLEEMGMFVPEGVNWTGDRAASRHLAVAATSSLFETLGVEAALGRTLSAAADEEGGPLEVVLSHPLWQSAFGGDPSVIGRTLVLNELSWEIVGVMPPRFDFPGGIIVPRADMFTSIGPKVPGWQDRASHPGIYVVGRMAEGPSEEAVRAEMTQIASRLSQIHPENREEGVYVGSVKAEVLGDLDQGLQLLSLAALLLVLVGLANAISLASARAMSRDGSTRVAQALGASRRTLALEAGAEGLALGALVAGVAICTGGAVLWGFREDLADLPRLANLEAGWGGIVALAAVAVLASIAVQVAAARPLSTRGMGPSSLVPGRTSFRARSGLVGAQVALTLLLATGSGVLLKSLDTLLSDDGGITAAGALSFRLALPATVYEGGDRTSVFYDGLRERIAGLPGVESVGGISTLPFSGAGSQSRMRPSGVQVEEGHRTDVNVIFEDYFEAMGVRRVAGRSFTPEDGLGSSPVVIVDERFAERFWGGANPIGQTVSGWGLEDAEVVGVVGHVKNYGVAAESREELYMPHRQRPYLSMYLIVRTALTPEDLLGPVRALVAELDPNVPVTAPSTMVDVVGNTVSTERLSARMAWAMATIAGLLAFFGAYALIANAVANRRREMGIRMALGADGRSVRRLVFAKGARVALLGLAVGLLLALASADLLESLLFGVDARAPDVYLAATATVALLTATAFYLPARRASLQDPADVLKPE